jgi:hypothetical protein
MIGKGYAVLHQPDISEKMDSWHMKDIEQGQSQYYTTPLEKAIQHEKRIPTFLDHFAIPKLPKDLYAKYMVVRAKHMFEAYENDGDDVGIARSVLYNIHLLNPNFTYRRLHSLTIDPVTKIEPVHENTVATWIKKTKKLVAENP